MPTHEDSCCTLDKQRTSPRVGMDATNAIIVDAPLTSSSHEPSSNGSTPSSPVDSHGIVQEVSKFKLSTVDWRWASRKGFWNPKRRCWNEEKGGIIAYLAQRTKSDLKPKPLVRKSKKVGIQAKIQKIVVVSKSCKMAGHRSGRAESSSKIHWRSIHFAPKSNTLSSVNRVITPHIKTSMLHSPLLEAMTQYGLGHSVARRFWTYGHCANSLSRIFHTIPHKLQFKIKQAAENMQKYVDANINRILSSDLSCKELPCSAQTNTQPLATTDENVWEKDMWEEDDINGVVQVEFDPCTQNRKSVVVNTRAAHLMNVRKHELVHLFNNHQVPLLMTDIDALRLFLVDLHSFFMDSTVHYLRRIVLKGTEFVGMLVCCTRVHVFTKAGQISQVRDCVRIVSVSEYDYAMHNHIATCPLAIMGDRRSGQELLDSAHADAQQTIWYQVKGKQGRKVLDQLIACTEQLRISMERQHLGAQEGCIDTHIPCHCSTESIVPAARNHAPDENGSLWSVVTSSRFWNVGYQTKVIHKMFNAIPRRLVLAIEKVSSVLKITIKQMVQDRISLSSGNLQSNIVNLASKLQDWLEEEAAWDEEQSRGFIRFEWWPTTNLRKHISLNNRSANSLNLSKDEALNRIAHNNLPLISTEMDMLRSFLFSLFHEFDDEIVEYTRRMVLVDGVVHPSLVCIRSKQYFNQWGQIYETKHASLAITSSEYDAALQHTPWACSLAVMGDRRSGSKLLACAHSDSRKTIASLAATRRGRSAFARIAHAIEDLADGPDARLWSLQGKARPA